MDKDRLKALRQEIILSEKLNEELLKPKMIEAIMRYKGTYVPKFGQTWDIILNEIYPIIQNNLPSIFFRNPRAFLKPKTKTYITKKRDPITGEKVEITVDSTKSANTQGHILNYTLVEIKYKNETRKCLLDALIFPHAVLWHGYKGEFGMTEERSIYIKDERIFVKRINPMRFIKDPAVTMADIEEGRWVGRVIDVPYIDFIEDDKLKIDKRLKIKGFQAYGDELSVNRSIRTKDSGGQDKIITVSSSLIDFADKDFKNSPYANFVKIYEIFHRPSKKERREGKKGEIILLTPEQDSPLRESEWKIKAEGWPAKILEFNQMPDSIFAMPDMDTYASVADQKNAIVNLQLRNAQENTKVWVGLDTDGADENDVEAVKNGKNSIILFKGSDKPIGQRMMVASPGGQASSELYLIDTRIQKNLEDKSGVTDLKRGFLQSGEESAASVKLRAAGGNARPLYRQDIMADFLKESLLYINQLNKQFVTIKDAVRIMGTLDIEWSENPSIEELQADVDVDLDVISMLPEDPTKELEELGRALALMIDGIRDPAIAAKIQQEGKTLNLSPIIEQMLLRLRINNPEIFRNIKPEESQGFVSVAEVRAAKANIQAALAGNTNIPSPPAKDQDHRARIETYTTVLELIQGVGKTIASEILTGLVQIHQAFLQELAEKETESNKVVGLTKGFVETAGR